MSARIFAIALFFASPVFAQDRDGLDDLESKYLNGKRLIQAVLEDDAFKARLLILSGADVDFQDKYAYGNTALIWAAEIGHLEMVHLLIEAGADVKLKNNYNQTALMKAVNGDHTEIVHLLMKAYENADLAPKDHFPKLGPFYACYLDLSFCTKLEKETGFEK